MILTKSNDKEKAKFDPKIECGDESRKGESKTAIRISVMFSRVAELHCSES